MLRDRTSGCSWNGKDCRCHPQVITSTCQTSTTIQTTGPAYALSWNLELDPSPGPLHRRRNPPPGIPRSRWAHERRTGGPQLPRPSQHPPLAPPASAPRPPDRHPRDTTYQPRLDRCGSSPGRPLPQLPSEQTCLPGLRPRRPSGNVHLLF